MHRIVMTLTFQRLPMLPKEEGIYWCIVKATETEKTEYHYSFAEFRDKEFQPFATTEVIFEVVAWAELENPERYFKPKMRIITN